MFDRLLLNLQYRREMTLNIRVSKIGVGAISRALVKFIERDAITPLPNLYHIDG